MRGRFFGCVAIFLMGFAFLSSTGTSTHDGQLPLVVRLLNGLHRETQFYASPASIPSRSSRVEHFRTAGPRMNHWGPSPGFGDVKPTRNVAPAPDYGSKKNVDWRVEILAWLPFGLLFIALLDRTSGTDEIARLLGEGLGAEKTPPASSADTGEPRESFAPVAMIAVRGQQSRRARPRQTLAEWICM